MASSQPLTKDKKGQQSTRALGKPGCLPGWPGLAVASLATDAAPQVLLDDGSVIPAGSRDDARLKLAALTTRRLKRHYRQVTP